MSFSEYLLYMVEPVEMLRKERSVNVEYEKHEKKKTWRWIFSSLEFDFIEAKMWLTHFILFLLSGVNEGMWHLTVKTKMNILSPWVQLYYTVYFLHKTI